MFNIAISELGLACENPFKGTFMPTEDGGKRISIPEANLKQVQLQCRSLNLGYDGHLGAEYIPSGATDDSFGWLAEFRTPD